MSLAGQLVKAKLPAGLQAGQKIIMLVRGVSAGQVVFQLLGQAAASRLPTAQLARRLAGQLMIRQDPQMIVAALGLLKLTQHEREEPMAGEQDAKATDELPPRLLAELPGQRLVELRWFDRASEGSGSDDEEELQVAHLILHGKHLGPLQMSLWVSRDEARVEVLCDRPAVDAVAAAAEQLKVSLERLLDRRVTVWVRPRPPELARPVDPRGFEAYG